MSSATLLTPVRPRTASRWPAADPAPLAAPPADRWLAAAVSAAVGGPARFAARAADPDAKRAFLAVFADETVRLGDRLLVVTADPDGWTRCLSAPDRPAVRAAAPGEAVPDDLIPHTASALSAVLARELEASAREAAEQLARWDAALPLYARAVDAAGPAADAPSPDALAAAEESLPRLREEWKQLAPLAEAKRNKQVGTGAFWKAMFTGDVAARAAELERQLHAAEAAVRAGEAATALRQACDGLRAAGLPAPDGPTPAAVQEAAARGQAVRRAAADRLAAARAAREELSAGRLPLGAVVVANPAGLEDAAVAAGGFDRVVIDADGLADEACAAAVERAERAVLIGAFDRPGWATEVWTELPKPAWTAEAGGRLVAQLDTLPDARPEPLADRPDVLVCIGSRADGSAGVAAVSFPAGTPAAEAVRFLAAELGEVRAVPAGPAHWQPDGLSARWPLADGPAEWAELEPGVWLAVSDAGGRPLTAAVRFDPQSWSRPAAEAWAARHLGPVRAVCLGGR